MECGQKNCNEEAVFMVFWASDRVPSCKSHANSFRGLAQGMGMPPPQINLIVGDGLEVPVEARTEKAG